MAVEIEAKMQVKQLSTVREKLTVAGASRIGSFLERNTFFDTEDRTLLAADEGLRTRLNRDVATGAETVTMTFKGARRHGPLKSRDEHEITVGSETVAGELLSALKYKTVLSFEKKRESWSIGGCRVELDELPHLGTFVEIEGPREAAVLAVRDQLGLKDRPLIKASYIAMLMQHIQEQGATIREVRFGDVAPSRVEVGTTDGHG